MKIVLGVDNEYIYREAVSLLGRLRFANSEIVAANVCEPVPLPAYAGAMLAPIEEIETERLDHSRNFLSSISYEISNRCGVDEISERSLIGSTANEILQVAKEEKADLVAIGSRRLGKMRSFFSGSVGRALVLNAETSFLVARSGVDGATDVSAIFATDHSDYANRCLDELLRLNPAGLTEIHIVFAADTVEELWMAAEDGSGGVMQEGPLTEQMKKMGEALVDKCIQSGRLADYRLVRQSQFNAIRHRMNATKSDLLILGAERHGLLERLLVGSVTLHEIVAEDFSVLVIRLPEENS